MVVGLIRNIGIAVLIAIVSLAVVGLLTNVVSDFSEEKGSVNAEIAQYNDPTETRNLEKPAGGIVVSKGDGKIEVGSGATVVYVNPCCDSSSCETGTKTTSTGCDCSFDYRFDPVCGTDGNTYINEYGAKLAGVAVAYKGYCESGGDEGCVGELCIPGGEESGCYDSDGGDNPKEKGYVEVGGTKVEDKCDLNGELTVQVEYFCSYGDMDSKEYFCQQGCSDGVCNEYK